MKKTYQLDKLAEYLLAPEEETNIKLDYNEIASILFDIKQDLVEYEKTRELFSRLFDVCKEYKHTSVGLSDDSEFINVMSELEELK